jgi:hypothetical protein
MTKYDGGLYYEGTVQDTRKSERYRKRFRQLKEETTVGDWRAHWKELSEYMLPRKGRYLSSDDTTEDNRGEKRNASVINGSSYDAIRTLSAGMQGGLTSPSRPWFRLTLPDADLAEFGPVRNWLHDVRNLMLHVFQRSNFYGAIHSVYEELGVFGTNAMLIIEDFRDAVRFRPYTVGEYYLANGPDYRPNTLYRRFTMTGRQIIDKWGRERVSHRILRSYEKNMGEDRFVVIHAIQPNLTYDPASMGIPGMRYESVYFEESPGEGNEEKLLEVSGFETMPFVAPRWSVTATDVYGRSPGMDALGDVKMLNKMETKSLKALDKMIDPPMNAPTTMRKYGNPNTLPGGVNYIDVQQGQQGFIPAYQISPRFQDMEFKIDRVEQRIRRFFFNDMFQMILGQEKTMTAREVAERHEEKLMMLGPVLERLQSEMLEPIITRTYHIMNGLGMLPPAPEEIEEGGLQIKYVSLLAQAQQMVAAPSIEQFVAFAGNLAAVHPSILDKVDFDQAVDEYGDMLGVTPKIIRSDDDVEELRAARSQQMQQQAQMEQAGQMVDAAKTLSETDVTTPNGLTQMIGGVA